MRADARFAAKPRRGVKNGEPTLKYPAVTIHERARLTHSDGSPVSVCEKCLHFDPKGPGSLPHVMVGYCGKNKHTNMIFGNCDFWWPKAEVRA